MGRRLKQIILQNAKNHELNFRSTWTVIVKTETILRCLCTGITNCSPDKSQLEPSYWINKFGLYQCIGLADTYWYPLIV